MTKNNAAFFFMVNLQSLFFIILTCFRLNINNLFWITLPLREVIFMYGRLRNLREDKDLSQREIAAVLDMSQTGYSKYETGENDIPTSILKKLALFHKTSTDYLLELTNDPKPYRQKNQR
jgi:DNA-binding XRE family transcriptional regulator